MNNPPPYIVLAYRGSTNLGDAIQTVALARWLPGPLAGFYRDALPHLPPDAGPRTVINGWLGYRATISPAARGVIAAGVHFGSERRDWSAAARNCFAHPVGCRDPFTRDLLVGAGVPAAVVGCATLTLPRYAGPRRGRIDIDHGGDGSETNSIPTNMAWGDQWAAALRLLRRLRVAGAVYTTRLHVAIPCLAMGTPVYVDDRNAEQPERFSVLDWLGVPRRELVVLPQPRYQEAKWRFLEHLGGALVRTGESRGLQAHDLVRPRDDIPYPATAEEITAA